jgi:hypothetical protein
MSFTDQLVLWLHIGFAIFTVGPLALAISSTPRSIRRRDVPVLRYLTRITLIFTTGSLLVLVFGIVLGSLRHDYSHPWLTAAMTLFVVALVLLVLIIRDQRRAIRALAPGDADPAMSTDPAAGTAGDPVGAGAADAGDDETGQPVATLASLATLPAHVASVERGRIAAMGGVVNLIWLVILALMVWQP